MKLWKVCVCLCLVGMISCPRIYAMDITDTSTNAKGITLIVDKEELKEGYSTYPTFVFEVDNDSYDPSMYVVLLDQEEKELAKVDVQWNLKNDTWVGECKYEHDVNNVRIAIMLEDEKLYLSETFDVDTSFHEPVIYCNDKKVEGNYFTSMENTMMKFVFDEAVDREKSSLYINGEKSELEWNEKENETTKFFEEDGEYEIAYTWFDKLGNEKKGAYQLKIDRESPVVELFLDHQKIDTLQPFYAKEAVLKLKIEDASFDVENSILYRNNRTVNTIWKKEGSSYIGEIKLDEGSHQIKYEIKDTFGHVTKNTLPLTIIDTTVPKVSLERANVEISTQQQLSYTIEDSNFDAEGSYLYVVHDGVEKYQKLEGSSTPSGYQGGYTFDDEGSYQAMLVTKDFAGNKSNSNHLSFLIDKSSPTLGILCNEQNMINEEVYATNKDVTVAFLAQDVTLRSHTITVYKNKQKIMEQASLESMHFQKEKQKNDDYVVTLRASDAAGNQSVQQVCFSILNNVKPLEIENDVFKNKPYAKGWTPQVKDDGTQLHILSSLLYKDHQPVSYQWGDEINEEGNYALELMGSDRAMNPTSLAQTFYFTIDKTPPLITLTKNHKPIPKTLYTKDTLTLSFVEKDIEKLREEHFAYIKINGKALDLNDDKSYQLTFDKAQDYTISCKVYDDAGNEQVKAWKFHVAHKPILTQDISIEQLGFAMIVVASIVIAFYLHARRKS